MTSYVTNDLVTGAQLEVNMTGPGSAFGPGYVARTVTGGVAHTYGEGLNPLQSPWGLSPDLQWLVDQLVWGRQMSKIISQSKCGCDN